MKSSLNDIQWKTFVIGELFEAKRPTARKENDYCDGDIPFIASGGNNNGVTKFCSPKNGENFDTENCLSVSPVDGSCYYQSYPFLGRGGAGSSIILLYPKNFTLDTYTALFLSKAITQTTAMKYSYGHMASLDRIKKDKIYLPADTNGEIDFQFMSSFMRQIEQRILKPTIDKLFKQLIINGLMKGKSLHSNWKAFYFTEVFTEIQRGKRLKKADHQVGNTPYVSSTSFNNGVDGFIGNDSSVRRFEDCLTLANSGSVGSAFYHRYEFIASDHITQLKREGLDKYAYLFMIPLINRLSEKYSFNREINDERIKREKLLLPVTDAGDIDFQFMSSFMKQIETDILGTTLATFKSRLKDNRLNINKLRE